ncbi:hypothetical protein KO02_08455 [Sphingobacterium sp. ML3W]|uniref:hypothetical protein n=1 Tax=Sphingobacterium sp. ML3W TaxID=1538644 RepID=UPI0004F61077|nr:hypothetical protein [Sphingobacterium sp. ML3W]AIM36730.1 hypothetical protein KO02_08455 [Sphingobacterium sp. ML3W]
MRTIKQRGTMQEAAWCEQYRKSNWGGCAVNAYFARNCHADAGPSYLNKPKHVTFDRLREIDIATNTVICDIAPLSFLKEKIVNYLTQLTPEKVFVPQNIVHQELYVNTYITSANDILEKIRQQRYDFQK